MTQRFPFFILFLLIAFPSFGQDPEIIRGIVVDSATFSPLPFVNIQLKGQLKGTTSDLQGNFTLVASKRDTLFFSLVGYQSFELPLWDWEPGLIRMAEKSILLKSVTIQGQALDPYEGMFDEQNEKIDRRKIPFYLSREKRQKRKLIWLREDNARAKTYVEVVINNPDTKASLMKKYSLTEEAYYDLLAEFNSTNYRVMYYLTAGELLTLLYNFFDNHTPQK